MFKRFLQRARALWRLALDERASPREVGLAIGVGVFVGCSPAVGFHGGIAVVLATILRLSRLWTFLGSRVANFLTLPWIALAEIEVAHRVRTGSFVPLEAKTILAHGSELLLDWCLGAAPVGGAIALLLGTIAYMLARRRARTRGDLTAT